jgi:hypothetical protein
MRLYQTLVIAKNYKDKNLDKSLEELSDFVTAINVLNNALYEGKVQIKPWQRNLELLLFKMTQHGGSIVESIRGKDRRMFFNAKGNYSDLASSYVLARALMETYLMTFYLNFESTNEDQCNFRALLYEMSGLFRRQSYSVDEKHGKKQLAAEMLQIEELKKRVVNNKYFQTLDPKRQRKLLTGSEAKEFSYEEILLKRGVKNGQVITLWKLYSNFAHSEYLSLIQLSDYIKNKQATVDALMSLIYEMIFILALQIVDLKSNFHSAMIAYNSLDTLLHANIEVRIDMAKSHFFSE